MRNDTTRKVCSTVFAKAALLRQVFSTRTAMKLHLDACPPCSDLIVRHRRERGSFERAASRETVDASELVREAERIAALPLPPRRPRAWLPVVLAAGLLLSLSGLLLH